MKPRRTLPALATLCGLLCAWPQALPAALTDEQRDALRDYFEHNDKFATFGSKPLELLGDAKLGEFASQYGNALLVVRIGNDLQAAHDADAVRKVFEKLSEEFLKRSFPGAASALGWFGWAKSGMELLNKFVYEPGVTQLALDSYAARRAEGADPDEAAIGIPWGPMRVLAFNQMMKQYNKELILAPGSKDRLTPVWERRLDQYLTSWMEQLYNARLMEEEKQKAIARVAETRAGLAAMDERLLRQLRGAGTTPAAPGPAGFAGAWGRGNRLIQLTLDDAGALSGHIQSPTGLWRSELTELSYSAPDRAITFKYLSPRKTSFSATAKLSADGKLLRIRWTEPMFSGPDSVMERREE